jgi:hypothetical protein
MPRLSCTDYNKRYPHGVGRLLAREKVRPGNDPVRNFRAEQLAPSELRCPGNKGLVHDKYRIAMREALR